MVPPGGPEPTPQSVGVELGRPRGLHGEDSQYATSPAVDPRAVAEATTRMIAALWDMILALREHRDLVAAALGGFLAAIVTIGVWVAVSQTVEERRFLKRFRQ